MDQIPLIIVAVLGFLGAIAGLSTNLLISQRARNEAKVAAIEAAEAREHTRTKLAETAHTVIEIKQLVNDRLDTALNYINSLQEQNKAIIAAAILVPFASKEELKTSLIAVQEAAKPIDSPNLPVALPSYENASVEIKK